MKTPKEYTKSINQGILTKQILLDCLYSSNKRAKNYRDKEREYRNYYRNNRYAYDKYDNEEKMRNKKEEYYKQKGILLSVLNPICIHKEHIGYERIRIYDYEKEYKKNIKNFVWKNCFWSYEYEREVYFGDIENKEHPIYHYYLFYDVGAEHTFHTPIEETELSKYKDLKIVNIDRLNTYGHDIDSLISNQFVKKVINLIKTNNYEYKEN